MVNVLVKTSNGLVRGVDEGDLAVFRGIPYAAAPVGALRFQAPQPPTLIEGEFDASRFGPTAPAPAYPSSVSEILRDPVIPGDEYLNLNVWTNAEAGAAQPVLVWIHGGAFTNGAGSLDLYDGSSFARKGIVTVTINYRLGVEGFAHVAGAAANRGVRDQIAALQWVRDNIAEFGGDPGQVTIAGESAGAMSVATLIASPAAAGLFHRAICQSGSGYYALSEPTAEMITARFAERLGVEPTVDGLASADLQELLALQLAFSDELANNPDPALWGEAAAYQMPFEPTIGDEIVPRLPIEAIRAGAGSHVDLLVGSNLDEQRLYLDPSPMTEEITAGTAAALGLSPDALEQYRSARTGQPSGNVFLAILVDWFFRLPGIRLAEATEQLGRTAYMYEFCWRSPQLGAAHYLEIPFVWNTLAAPSAAPLLGSRPPQHVADEMHAAWAAFVAQGSPGWPAYRSTDRSTMSFDLRSALVEDPRGDERRAWDDIR